MRFGVSDNDHAFDRSYTPGALEPSLLGKNPLAAFFTALRQDPLLAGVHLIAEPWDAGYDGYQLGRFPGRFIEWNDKFRDTVREFTTSLPCLTRPSTS